MNAKCLYAGVHFVNIDWILSIGITVNNIAPGLIESEMAKTVPEKIKEKIINKIALKKLGTPRAISELVYFLVTNEGNYITGQTIRIDGGLLN